MDALDHVDPIDGYGHMASAHDAAKEFVDDLRSKGSVKESGTGDEPYDFNKAAIEAVSGDKISHTEEDDEGEPIYWSTKNPNVNYYIGGDEQIIKYDGETGERYPIGDLRQYDEPTHDYEPDTDADYEEPRDDFDMAGDYNDGEFWEGEVKKFKKIAGIKEDDYSEDPFSGVYDDSETGDTASMGNINEWNPDKEWDEEDEEEGGEDYPSDEELFGVSEEEINEAEGFKFKKGDVVKSRISKGNDLVVLIAYPNLEAAYKDRGENEPDTWEDSIVNGEMGPVSDDIANKPWYLTWTREVERDNLLTCDPEEFLSK